MIDISPTFVAEFIRAGLIQPNGAPFRVVSVAQVKYKGADAKVAHFVISSTTQKFRITVKDVS